jgi:hypothetical protein
LGHSDSKEQTEPFGDFGGMKPKKLKNLLFWRHQDFEAQQRGWGR